MYPDLDNGEVAPKRNKQVTLYFIEGYIHSM